MAWQGRLDSSLEALVDFIGTLPTGAVVLLAARDDAEGHVGG